MNKIALIIIIIAVVVSISIIVFGGPGDSSNSARAQPAQNVEVQNGVQYITITARGGYSPKTSVAQANIPTKLIVKTNGIYDCSAVLVIRSIGYQKILPQTGEEVIDLGIPKTGTLRGSCSMGMYGFSIEFK